jgi:hypothetical protein
MKGGGQTDNRLQTTDNCLLRPCGFVALRENHVNAGDGLSDRGSWDMWGMQEQSQTENPSML